jgi:hypothetical protein
MKQRIPPGLAGHTQIVPLRVLAGAKVRRMLTWSVAALLLIAVVVLERPGIRKDKLGRLDVDLRRLRRTSRRTP